MYLTNNLTVKEGIMKSALIPYLNFKNKTREAMEYYKTVFGGVIQLQTYKEFGMSQNPADDDKIMHSMIEAENGLTFMAADFPEGMEYTAGNNFSMSLSGPDETELRGYFDKLAAGGKITMPLEKAPWGDIFGQLTDKFGITWMFNIGEPRTMSM